MSWDVFKVFENASEVPGASGSVLGTSNEDTGTPVVNHKTLDECPGIPCDFFC